MHVTEILSRKGNEVATVKPDAAVSDAVGALRQAGVGALVVSVDGSSIDGILSERDVVRALADDGASLLDRPVSDIMTTEVRTCAVDDTVSKLMESMTEHRIRHLPVATDGELVGIVSIGDVVKFRVNELEDEARHLEKYIQGH